MTHPCCLDRICDLDEKLLVLGGILAPHEDFDGESAALDLVEIFRCEACQQTEGDGRRLGANEPFFWVVRM
jgi:hypothetical protein